MKIAFVLIPEKGHVNPYIGPAQALQQLGHEVTVAAPGDIGPQLARAGLTFDAGLVGQVAEDRITRGPGLVELIQDAARLDQWIEQLLLGGIHEAVEKVRGWFRRERPSVVAIDPLYYAAAIAAHLEGIPWASVSNSLNPVIPPELDSALLRTVRRLSPRRSEIFAAFGMEARFSGCDVLSPYLTVAFATEELVGTPPAGVTLAGPSLPLQARGDELTARPLPCDRPIVYASFGSQIYYWPAIFDKLAAAADRLNVHLVLAMGDLGDEPRWSPAPPHCDVYRYAPQQEILRAANAFVTHGGANSVMEAIAAGVPMLLSPMCNDQFHQAWFIERAGIGRVEDLVHLPVEGIVEALRHLLTDRDLHSRMQAISQSYQVNGARTAARLIAALGTEGGRR